MKITKQDLNDAVNAGVLEETRAEKLWQFLANRANSSTRPRFDLTNLLWYVGALIIISAMGIFSTEAFGRWGGNALASTAFIYGAAFVAAGHYFWRVRKIRILGGLLITVAVSMAPLATFGLQDHLGWWTHGEPGVYRDFFIWVRGSWVIMSLSAIAAGVIALRFYMFPFIVMVIAFALWFLSMDLTPWLLTEWPRPVGEGQTQASQIPYWQIEQMRGLVSTLFGFAVLFVAWFLDLRFKADLAFWPHLAAGLSINGGMYFWLTGDGYEWAILCAVSVVLLLLSIFLQRRVYAVFGGLGVASYLGYLSSEVFEDTILFSFALTGIGIIIMVSGYAYFKHESTLRTWMNHKLPAALRHLRPEA